MLGRLSAEVKKPVVSSDALEMLEQPEQLVLGRGRRFRRLGERQLVALGLPPPLVGHEQHRLGDVERGERRLDRQRDDGVGDRDLLVVEPPALAAEQDAGLAAAGDVLRDVGASRPRGRARPSACRGGARWSRRPDRDRRWPRPASRTPAPCRAHGRPCDAAATACSFGQPSRGLTSRRSQSPKLAMARAAAPMFSPSCGSTRITAGEGRNSICCDLSVPAMAADRPLAPPESSGLRRPCAG